MINVTCPVCLSINKISDPVKYQGKSIRFACSNVACSHTIVYTVPFSKAPDQTYIIPKVLYGEVGQLILMKNAYHAQTVYKLKQGEQIVGRKSVTRREGIELDTNDLLISRQHFIITGVKEKNSSNLKFSIRENQGRNKALLNGKEFSNDKELFLQDGDKINIGESTLVFMYL